MKLKKRTDKALAKNSIYNQYWSYWIKQGVEDTTENRDIYVRNRGKKGDWILTLLLSAMIDDTPIETTEPSKEFIEQQYELPVVLGTHPIPLKYLETHSKLPFWDQTGMKELVPDLMAESRDVMESYN